MDESKLVSIQDLIQTRALVVGDGYRTKRSELSSSGYRIIRVADVQCGEAHLNGPDFVSREFSRQIGAKAGKSGDILLTTKGTVGRVAELQDVDECVVYSPQLCFFRVLPNSTLVRGYLRYWFSSPEFIGQCANAKGNTDMADYINLADIRSLQLCLPPLPEQRAIAEVLGALDDKIAANTRKANKVDRLARALFEPLASRAVKHTPLGKFVQVTKGVSYRGVDLQASRSALVTLKSVDRNGKYAERGLKPFIGPYRASQVIVPGEIVVAQTDLTQAAEVVGRAVRVPVSANFDVLVASLDLAIVRPKSQIPKEYLLGVISHGRFRRHCQSHTSGTTVLHLASGAIDTYPAPVVPAADQLQFAARTRPLHELIDSTNRESRLLARTRDTLLPQLMSGKLRVRDAEQLVEEVV